MSSLAQNYLKDLEIGSACSFDNLTICPVSYSGVGGPRYQSLSEALAAKTVIIEEVDERGQVPELKVRNEGETAVLIMGGEELLGAKQNRVPNTTILVDPGHEITIPVTCTEQGRWARSTIRFRHSGYVMPHSLRSRKLASVTDSLKHGTGYSSDQAGVWSDIDELAFASGSSSRTRAMRDTYAHLSRGIDQYLAAFPVKAGQSGMMAFIDSRPAGCDVLSDAGIYVSLHTELVASYALVAVFQAQRRGREPGPTHPLADGAVADFLAAIAQCSDRQFDSVGRGTEFRFESPDVVGSALVVDDAVIHATFLPRPGDQAQSSDSSEAAGARRVRDVLERIRRRA